MNITLYNTKADKRDLNKTLNTIGSKTAVLKDNNSVTHPSLVLETFDGWEECNYIFIDDFNRYYFVDDIKPMIGNKLTIVCSVDVLMSHRSQLNSLYGICLRSSVQGNVYIPDDKIRVTSQIFTETKVGSKSFNENFNYILTVCG